MDNEPGMFDLFGQADMSVPARLLAKEWDPSTYSASGKFWRIPCPSREHRHKEVDKRLQDKNAKVLNCLALFVMKKRA